MKKILVRREFNRCCKCGKLIKPGEAFIGERYDRKKKYECYDCSEFSKLVFVDTNIKPAPKPLTCAICKKPIPTGWAYAPMPAGPAHPVCQAFSINFKVNTPQELVEKCIEKYRWDLQDIPLHTVMTRILEQQREKPADNHGLF